jgi:hypothetical protein
MPTPVWNEQEQQVHEDGNTPIRADVLLDLHPGILEPHGVVLNKQGTPGQDIYAASRKAQKAFTENLGQMRDVHRVLRSLAQPISTDSGMKQPRGNVVVARVDGSMAQPLPRGAEYAVAAEQAFKRGVAAFDSAMVVVNRNGEQLGSELLKALTVQNEGHPKPLAMAQEVRAHVKALPEGKRFGFVKQAIEAGDHATVCAVVNAQPFLSGLSDAHREVLRGLAAEKFAPVVWAQMRAAQAIREKLTANRASFEREYVKTLPVRSAKQDAADAALAKLRAAGSV